MNLKRIIFLFFIVYCLKFPVCFAQEKTIELYFFYDKGCPYCAQMAQELQKIQEEYPQLKINAFEVWSHLQNQKLLNALSEAYKIKPSGVPVVFVGNLAIEGVDPYTLWQIKEEVRRCMIVKCFSPIEKIKMTENKVKINWKNILIFTGAIVFIIFLISLLKKKRGVAQ